MRQVGLLWPFMFYNLASSSCMIWKLRLSGLMSQHYHIPIGTKPREASVEVQDSVMLLHMWEVLFVDWNIMEYLKVFSTNLK
ncbi:unnamed protein product [Ambrosiozyma monospora]|uniref:Unnamed protein product n=1 Tax=Ambrosiozyma monospora TaxID=43982 RepID=A0ACB5SYA8_AMBMO|nr:unnamed protein product [Ambrosiozyma monospora]